MPVGCRCVDPLFVERAEACESNDGQRSAMPPKNAHSGAITTSSAATVRRRRTEKGRFDAVERMVLLHRYEGRQVSVTLADGTQLGDCLLVSAGRGRVQTLWIFTDDVDTFIPRAEVAEICLGGRKPLDPTRSPSGTRPPRPFGGRAVSTRCRDPARPDPGVAAKRSTDDRRTFYRTDPKQRSRAPGVDTRARLARALHGRLGHAGGYYRAAGSAGLVAHQPLGPGVDRQRLQLGVCLLVADWRGLR